jgi:beta-glucosidase
MTVRFRRLVPGGRVPAPVALAAAPLAAVLAAATLLAAYTAGRDDLDAAPPVGARVEELLARMSLDDKIGQMTQVDRAALDPVGDLGRYRVGAVRGPVTADGYDALQRAALASPLRIPILYGVDAPPAGGTVFPANIGLGASRDPDLAQRVGRATAEEVAATGADWIAGPCLCVARNDRWVRAGDSFGEKPEIANAMTTMVTGLQGPALGGPASVLATATGYVGDGATTNGVDEGDALTSEADLRALHLAPFRSAVQRGVGSVRVSSGGWNGHRLHAHHYLITDVLKRELGFDGIVVGDVVGLDSIDGQEGFTEAEVAATVNAGVDMVVVDDYRRFVALLRSAVQAGRVAAERVDDAARRVLTKKFELGLFERPFADPGLAAAVGSPAHRDLARDAVRRSVVLLKNAGRILPLGRGGRIFVAGGAADDLARQRGAAGSTRRVASTHAPGTTILDGIRAAAGSAVTYHRDGVGVDASYRVAVAVVGEAAAADEAPGGSATLVPDPRDLAAVDRIRAAGVPVVVVLVAGRPLDVAARLRGWDALLAAWLPGSEGRGVADVLFGDHNPTARLPVTWMSGADQQPINDGDGKPPLFPYDFGLSYPAPATASAPPGSTPPREPSRPAPPRPRPCSVEYRIVNQWDVGFQADLTIRNTGPARVDGWRLVWTFDSGQRITQLWGGEATVRGSAVTVRNADWNRELPPGATATVGFTASHTGRNPVPGGFRLNGATCLVR